MKDISEGFRLSAALEQEDEWRKWTVEIPYINWPSDWEVKAIPPMTGAIIRYRIKHQDDSISVYLDCYDRLGAFGEPYWEVYPIGGDTGRCAMNDTDRLIELVKEAKGEL